MKLQGARAAAFARAPAEGVTGVLLHGADPARIALHRADLVAAVTGGDPMRLDRIEPDTARRDPAALSDALRARGFFPGRRAVLVEGAKDGVAEAVGAALDGLAPDDALLIVTATGLTSKSSLRKMFEGGRTTAALVFYEEDPGEDPADLLAAAGLSGKADAGAEAAFAEAAAALDAGSARRLAETLALHALDRDRLEAADVAALAPVAGAGSGTDALAAAVAAGDPGRTAGLVARLAGQGVTPQAMLSAVSRQFRLVHRLATDPAGPARAVERVRPPVWGPRRDRAVGAARDWGTARTERAIRLLHAAERALRRAGDRPDRALAERCLLRVALMRPRGGA